MPSNATAASSATTADGAAARLSLLLASTGEGIFGVDTDGRCTFINRAGAEMLGRRTEDVLGRDMHRLMHHTHPDGRHYHEHDCPIFAAFRSGTPCRVDRDVLWRADGSSFPAEYSSHPMVEGGAVQGAVVTFVDITERKLAEEMLGAATAALEDRVAARTAELSEALQRVRELGAWLASVREDERTRIARDVHDELGSFLVALQMDVGWVAARVGDRPEIAGKCGAMTGRIAAAVDTVGRIITDLRPSILDHQGLWAAIEWQASEFRESTGLACDLGFHVAHGVQPPAGQRGERWAIAVFRIVQEMLSNVARHARASRVRVRLYVDGPPAPELHLEVQDDGVGFDGEAQPRRGGFGVLGMRERAAHFGGTVEVSGRVGRGTRARLRMPMPTVEADAADPSDGAAA